MQISGSRYFKTVWRKLMVLRLNIWFKYVAMATFSLVLLIQMKLLFWQRPEQFGVQLYLSQLAYKYYFNSKGYINMEVWRGLCLLNFNSLRQYPLFPWQPDETAYMKVRDTLIIDKTGPHVAVRTMGYLHPPKTGLYSFHLRSNVMAQLWISLSGPSNATKVAYTTHNTVEKYTYSAGVPRPFSSQFCFQAGKKYYFEVWKAVNAPLDVKLQRTVLDWLLPDEENFVPILGKHVSLYYILSSHNHITHTPTNDTVVKSASLQFSDEEDKATGPFFPLNKNTTTNRRVKLDSNMTKITLKLDKNPFQQMETDTIPYLEDRIITSAFPKCRYDPSYMKRTSYRRYEAVWYINYPEIYPYDGSWNIRWGAPYKNQFARDDRFDGAVFFQDSEAVSVSKSFIKLLDDKYPGDFKLSRIINIEKVRDKQKGDRFFLELVLRRRHDNKLHRVSQFFYRNISQSDLCFLDNLRWNPKVWINVILNVKNQAVWMIYFIKEMARVLRETREHHVNFIIIDYGNYGMDIGKEMNRQGIKSYQVIRKSGRFYKTSSINMAASHVKDSNSIVLLMDLHLKYPNNFFQKIRKHTIQGKLAFAPILMRLDRCGRPETNHLYSSGFWESLGFGIFGIYKSDWDTFGGMNEKEYKNKWGGEDWEMVDRVLAKGIEVDKLRVIGFYHFYHDKKGMWNN